MELFRVGFADIFRAGLAGISQVRVTRFQRASAVRRDGSTVSRTSEKVGAGFFTGATEQNSFSEMYLAPGDGVVQVNDKKRTYSSRKSTWHDRPDRGSVDGDTVCSTAFRVDNTGFKLAGETTVAGVPVVKWVHEDRLNRQEVYLTPLARLRGLKEDLDWAKLGDRPELVLPSGIHLLARSLRG